MGSIKKHFSQLSFPIWPAIINKYILNKELYYILAQVTGLAEGIK